MTVIRWRWFTAAAADPAFHDRVHARRLNSGVDDPGASGLKDGVERSDKTNVLLGSKTRSQAVSWDFSDSAMKIRRRL
jgi:hypothetical protein